MQKSLRFIRSSLRLTQARLAEEAGLSETTIIDIEKGRSKPRLSTAIAIVEALNAKLTAKGKPEITTDSLSWTIQGEAQEEETQGEEKQP